MGVSVNHLTIRIGGAPIVSECISTCATASASA